MGTRGVRKTLALSSSASVGLAESDLFLSISSSLCGPVFTFTEGGFAIEVLTEVLTDDFLCCGAAATCGMPDSNRMRQLRRQITLRAAASILIDFLPVLIFLLPGNSCSY